MLRLSELLFFMQGTARASRSNMSPNKSTRMHLHMCVHMQMFSTKLCMHPLKTPRLLNTGEGDYQEEEKWGLKVSGVLLRLVSSLWCKLQDLLSHWGHWAQRACKETHTQSMRHRTVFTECAEKFLVLLPYHLQKWTQTLKWGDSHVTLLVTMAANIKNFQSSKPWRERKYFSR